MNGTFISMISKLIAVYVKMDSLIFFVILVISFKACKAINTTPKTTPKFPAVFIFGDSTVDSGNNNYFETLGRANHKPYGQDFPGHVPTGRFSNGKLVSDFLASMLGIKETVPPFLDPSLSDHELQTGVCFASSGAGYDDITPEVTRVIPVMKQVELFKKYITRLKGIVGEEEAKKTINGSLVIISAGTNDFAFNFYDAPTRRLQFNVSQYQDFLQNRLQNFVKQLYDLGSRKMLIAGLVPIGCLPFQITLKFRNPLKRKCIENQNLDARNYNEKLVNLLPQMQAKLPQSHIAYADVYEPLSDMINNPTKYGFEKTKNGCCGTGLIEFGPLCTPVTPTCEKVSNYLFWDAAHPTEPAYRHIAEMLVKEAIPKLV